MDLGPSWPTAARAGGASDLVLDDIATTVNVLHTRRGRGTTAFAACQSVRIGDEGALLSRVVVHLLNYHGRLGGEGLAEASAGDEYGAVWTGRNTLIAEGWHITIDARRQHREIVEVLHASSGYGFTHVAEIRRTDGAMFTAVDASEVLWCLAGLLSFARGAWVAPMLPVGYNVKGVVAWREWGEPRCSEWHTPQSWIDDHHQEDLAQVAPGFFERWYRGGCWQESVWRAVGLYVEGNAVGGRHPGMIETRVILAQAGLELLAWVLLDDGCNQPIGEERRPTDKAAERIRGLLTRAHIPSPDPNLLPALDRFTLDCRAEDAVHAVTELRNRFTHPRRRDGRYTAEPPPRSGRSLARAQTALRKRSRSSPSRFHSTSSRSSRPSSSARSAITGRRSGCQPGRADPAVSCRRGAATREPEVHHAAGLPQLEHSPLRRSAAGVRPAADVTGHDLGRVRPEGDGVGHRHRPELASRSDRHRSISLRNHSLQRPWPRSTTGRGIAGYRRWYAETVLRCARPSSSATPCASLRSSASRYGGTLMSLQPLTGSTRGCPDDRRAGRCAGPP